MLAAFASLKCWQKRQHKVQKPNFKQVYGQRISFEAANLAKRERLVTEINAFLFRFLSNLYFFSIYLCFPFPFIHVCPFPQFRGKTLGTRFQDWITPRGAMDIIEICTNPITTARKRPWSFSISNFLLVRLWCRFRAGSA